MDLLSTWPAAAVKRDPQALPGFIGRKAFVGGSTSLWLKTQGLTLRKPEILLD